MRSDILKGTTTLLLLLSFAVPAWADDKPKPIEKGDEAKEVTLGSWGKWLNLPKGIDKLEWKDLKGHIIVVEFYATWCGACKASIKPVSRIQKKYRKEAVIVLGVSNERGSVVQEFVREHKVDFITGGDAKKTMETYGVKAYPTFFVIAPDGTVKYKGHNYREVDQTIKWLLEFHHPEVRSLLWENDAKLAYKRAGRLMKRKEYLEGLDAYEELVKTYDGTKAAKTGAKMIEKIKGNKKAMARVKKQQQKRDCKNWLSAARRFKDSGEKDKAAEYYKRIIKKYPRSKSADVAKEELASL